MELRKFKKENNTNGHLDMIIANFYQDLCSQLSLNNASLQKTCIENSEKIKALRLEKCQLFDSICSLNQASLNSNEYMFVFHLASNSELWKHSLQFGLQKVGEGVARHNESCREWKRAAELQLQVIQDDFTMMPFHDVETEMNKIDVEIHGIRKKTQEITQKFEARNNALETEFKQLLHSVSTLEPYKREIRKSKEHLNQVLAEIQTQLSDTFHATSTEQKILQTQKDIDELQKQITALQQLQS